jgi:hypothetical protein
LGYRLLLADLADFTVRTKESIKETRGNCLEIRRFNEEVSGKMKYEFCRNLALAVFASALIGPVWGAETISTTPASVPPAGKPIHFPPVKLRGYGVVSGDFTARGKGGSLLTIHCESESKARIVEAKYLSDLGLLPGVTAGHEGLAARRIQGQGVITASRSDHDVMIVAADDNAPAGTTGDTSDITEKDAGVPMYLDRWDRYGMRYYYAALALPSNISAPPTPTPYSPANDFTFAMESGNCGLVLWQSAFPTEQAEGILKTPMWEWVVTQAQKTGVPLGINLSTGVPCSLYNRYRDEWTMADPQYLGGYYGLLSPDEGIFSWDSVAGRDAQLAELQLTIRQFDRVDNIVNWLNPDGEMGHDAPDNLINFGPTADAGYRQFLKAKYGTLQDVATRWFGDGSALHSWSDVHVPELASFLGWGKDAVDLTGAWKVGRAAAPGAETAAPAFDDSSWPSMTAPGDAIGILLPHKSAVFRRHVTIDAQWRAAHDKIWLYVFDLSDTRGGRDNPDAATTRSFLNGIELTEAEPAEPYSQSHWAAYDVSSSLKAGDNVVAVDLPQGFFNYRVYFSPQAPRGYPDLGPQLNAQWADFIDWGSWSRANAVKHGSQMIRQADPNRPITFMAPDSYADDIKTVCEDYGGVFHNTGYMAGVWADFNAMQMESVNLPTDEEPGSGAKTLTEFKGFLGRWSTEGIQGVDYFQHIGDVEWNPEIKSYFHDTLNLWHLMGKYHVPKAQVALLASDRIDRLYGFPFHHDRRVDLPHGQWDLRFNELLMPDFAREEVFPHDFERGYADPYKVILDSNTSVMDPDLVASIGRWVKAGGIFMTFGDTGRNTSVLKDAWPISAITGYGVTATEQSLRHLAPAEGQQLIVNDTTWRNMNVAGNTLEKKSPDCVDLLTYGDGTTAAGLRSLGKGYVITLGAHLGMGEAKHFFENILDWAKIPRIPATAPGVLMRHFVSNNGLYDVWAMWNSKQLPVSTTLTISNGLHLDSAWDVKTAQSIPLGQSAAGATMPVNLDSYVTQVVLTPRHAITNAPAEWFALQRNWWRGSGDPGAPMPEFKAKYTLDLQPAWSFKPLDGDASQGAALADPKLDDSSWEKRPLGIFNFAPHGGPLHAMFRKAFTVPDDWTAGPVTLWLSEWHGVGYLDHGQAYLDGQPVSNRAILGDERKGALKPGATHTLAVEIWGSNPVVGTPASVWLNYRPDAHQHQDLAGEWAPALDGLSYTQPVMIPGPYKGLTLRRTVTVDDNRAGQTAVLRISATNNSIYGVIVNGTWISRFHHHVGNDFDIAITPYLKFGRDNQIALFGGNGSHVLKNVSLEFYAKGTYP